MKAIIKLRFILRTALLVVLFPIVILVTIYVITFGSMSEVFNLKYFFEDYFGD